MTFEELLKAAHGAGLVGRDKTLKQIHRCLEAGLHVLLEGPVGVGKTFLVQTVLQVLGRNCYRIDGDSRYTEQKLLGHFDPTMVMDRGFVVESFVPGPLVEAMEKGSVLFINELNRMPEAVQNVLLPALDERRLVLPQLGVVEAAPSFQVIATQNPREFVATSSLSEALQDRLEWILLSYQSLQEEISIVAQQSGVASSAPWLETICYVVRSTRQHPQFKRGASVRAAISAVRLLGGSKMVESPSDDQLVDSLVMALATRVELSEGAGTGGVGGASEIEDVLTALVKELVATEKKKTI